MQITQEFRKRICDLAQQSGTMPAVKEIQRVTGVATSSAVRALEVWMAEANHDRPVRSSESRMTVSHEAGFKPNPPAIGGDSGGGSWAVQPNRQAKSSATRAAPVSAQLTAANSRLAANHDKGISCMTRACPPYGNFTRLAANSASSSQARGGGIFHGSKASISGQVCRIVAIILLVMGGLKEIEVATFSGNSAQLQGIVTALDRRGNAFVPFVEFWYNNDLYSVTGEFPSKPATYRIGQAVAVALNPESQVSRIMSGTERWLVSSLLLGGGFMAYFISNLLRARI